VSLSTSRLAYTDCFEALDRALEDEKGVRVKATDEGQANHLRMRMHQARKIDRQDNCAIYEEGAPLYARSVYDPLTLKIRLVKGEYYIYIIRNTLPAEVESLTDIKDEVEALPSPEPQPQITTSPVQLAIEHIKRRV